MAVPTHRLNEEAPQTSTLEISSAWPTSNPTTFIIIRTITTIGLIGLDPTWPYPGICATLTLINTQVFNIMICFWIENLRIDMHSSNVSVATVVPFKLTLILQHVDPGLKSEYTTMMDGTVIPRSAFQQ